MSKNEISELLGDYPIFKILISNINNVFDRVSLPKDLSFNLKEGLQPFYNTYKKNPETNKIDDWKYDNDRKFFFLILLETLFILLTNFVSKNNKHLNGDFNTLISNLKTFLFEKKMINKITKRRRYLKYGQFDTLIQNSIPLFFIQWHNSESGEAENIWHNLFFSALRYARISKIQITFKDLDINTRPGDVISKVKEINNLASKRFRRISHTLRAFVLRNRSLRSLLINLNSFNRLDISENNSNKAENNSNKAENNSNKAENNSNKAENNSKIISILYDKNLLTSDGRDVLSGFPITDLTDILNIPEINNEDQLTFDLVRKLQDIADEPLSSFFNLISLRDVQKYKNFMYT